MKSRQHSFSSNGQNMIEYMILTALVVVIFIAAWGPSGIFTREIDKSLVDAELGIYCMTINTCYDPEGCPSACGDLCCDTTQSSVRSNVEEKWSTCAQDCGCSDGIGCTVEQCTSLGAVSTADDSRCPVGFCCSVTVGGGGCVPCGGGGSGGGGNPNICKPKDNCRPSNCGRKINDGCRDIDCPNCPE